MSKFKGIIPAIITPFDEKGLVFEEGIKNEIDYLCNHGFENIFICGSYGAFPIMTTEERKFVAAKAVQFCQENKMKSIVHIGSTSLDVAIQLAKHAEDVGADAVSSVIPFYYSATIYTEENFLIYFEEIVKSISIDVHCYNNPNATGFNISPNFLGRLIDTGVRGMKDGGSDMGRTLEMLNSIEKSGNEFDYYLSSTASLIIGSILGVEACISGVSLSVPELVMGIYDNMTNRNIDKAISLYRRVMKVRSILGSKSGRAIAAYTVLNEKGVNVGTCKAPWRGLNQEDAVYVVRELKNLGAI